MVIDYCSLFPQLPGIVFPSLIGSICFSFLFPMLFKCVCDEFCSKNQMGAYEGEIFKGGMGNAGLVLMGWWDSMVERG